MSKLSRSSATIANPIQLTHPLQLTNGTNLIFSVKGPLPNGLDDVGSLHIRVNIAGKEWSGLLLSTTPTLDANAPPAVPSLTSSAPTEDADLMIVDVVPPMNQSLDSIRAPFTSSAELSPAPSTIFSIGKSSTDDYRVEKGSKTILASRKRSLKPVNLKKYISDTSKHSALLKEIGRSVAVRLLETELELFSSIARGVEQTTADAALKKAPSISAAYTMARSKSPPLSQSNDHITSSAAAAASKPLKVKFNKNSSNGQLSPVSGVFTNTSPSLPRRTSKLQQRDEPFTPAGEQHMSTSSQPTSSTQNRSSNASSGSAPHNLNHIQCAAYFQIYDAIGDFWPTFSPILNVSKADLARLLAEKCGAVLASGKLCSVLKPCQLHSEAQQALTRALIFGEPTVTATPSMQQPQPQLHPGVTLHRIRLFARLLEFGYFDLFLDNEWKTYGLNLAKDTVLFSCRFAQLKGIETPFHGVVRKTFYTPSFYFIISPNLLIVDPETRSLFQTLGDFAAAYLKRLYSADPSLVNLIFSMDPNDQTSAWATLTGSEAPFPFISTDNLWDHVAITSDPYGLFSILDKILASNCPMRVNGVTTTWMELLQQNRQRFSGPLVASLATTSVGNSGAVSTPYISGQ